MRTSKNHIETNYCIDSGPGGEDFHNFSCNTEVTALSAIIEVAANNGCIVYPIVFSFWYKIIL